MLNRGLASIIIVCSGRPFGEPEWYLSPPAPPIRGLSEGYASNKTWPVGWVIRGKTSRP